MSSPRERLFPSRAGGVKGGVAARRVECIAAKVGKRGQVALNLWSKWDQYLPRIIQADGGTLTYHDGDRNYAWHAFNVLHQDNGVFVVDLTEGVIVPGKSETEAIEKYQSIMFRPDEHGEFRTHWLSVSQTLSVLTADDPVLHAIVTE